MVVGVDVGAPSKGYHAAALQEAAVVATLHSRDAAEIAQWCSLHDAAAVAVDAPCRWRVPGQPARAAERELAADRIACFSTPTEDKARGHAFYEWMFAGQELYAALTENYPIYRGAAAGRASLETFPQAVACALAGGVVSAKSKLAVRRELLRRAGIRFPDTRKIDVIDAVLCAVAARSFVDGAARAYGDVAGGFIIVPRDALPAPRGDLGPRADGGKPSYRLQKVPFTPNDHNDPYVVRWRNCACSGVLGP